MTMNKDCKFCAAIREVAIFAWCMAGSVAIVGLIALALLWVTSPAWAGSPIQEPLRIVVEQEGPSVLVQTLASVAAICTAAAGVLAYVLKRRK